MLPSGRTVEVVVVEDAPQEDRLIVLESQGHAVSPVDASGEHASPAQDTFEVQRGMSMVEEELG
jgi:hypothetical protein